MSKPDPLAPNVSRDMKCFILMKFSVRLSFGDEGTTFFHQQIRVKKLIFVP